MLQDQTVSDRQGKHFLAQDCFYCQGVFSYMYINERDPSSSDYKHKHILENGAPPDTFGVLYCLLHIKFHDFNSNIKILGLSHLVNGINSIFSDGMGPCIIRGIWEHYGNTLCTLRHFPDKNNTIKLTVCVACPL